MYRLEEREQETKKEYSKLHERYTELFKTHMDYMERTKIIMGNSDRLEGTGRSRLGNLGMNQLTRSVHKLRVIEKLSTAAVIILVVSQQSIFKANSHDINDDDVEQAVAEWIR